MIQKRFVSLLLCAALALCLLAGCDTAASGSTGSASAPANSSASASSENIPSTTNEANTSGLRPNFDENSLFSITGTSDAFEPCLGWGPGVSGCSLKSVLAAASLLQWSTKVWIKLKNIQTQKYINMKCQAVNTPTCNNKLKWLDLAIVGQKSKRYTIKLT